MHWLGIAVAVAVVGGCDRGDSEVSPDPLVVRVSASFGLAELSPGPRQSGSSAMVLDLVFEPLARFLEVESVDGASLVFRVLPDAPPVADLATTLRVEGLVEAVPLDEKRMRVTMSSPQAAAGLRAMQFGGFQRGPFAAEPWRPGDPLQRLRALDDRPVRVIELVQMAVEEQWRRLLAREIDVVPHNTMRQREYYEGLESVRLLELPSDRSLSLVFDLDQVPDARERRSIAGSLEVGAIARVSAGSAEFAARTLVGGTAADDPFMPARRLRIGYLESDQFAADAARVVRLQLERAGYEVILEAATLQALGESEREAVIVPFPEGDAAVRVLGTPGLSWHYENPSLRDAVERDDFAAARAIVDHDVPVIPLVRNVAFAAVDARLCGGEPSALGTWDWIADLYPCEDVR